MKFQSMKGSSNEGKASLLLSCRSTGPIGRSYAANLDEASSCELGSVAQDERTMNIFVGYAFLSGKRKMRYVSGQRTKHRQPLVRPRWSRRYTLIRFGLCNRTNRCPDNGRR